MITQDISNFDNPRFKLWMSLKKAKGIKKTNKCLVLGEKILLELLKDYAHLFDAILYSQHSQSNSLQNDQLLSSTNALSMPVFRL